MTDMRSHSNGFDSNFKRTPLGLPWLDRADLILPIQEDGNETHSDVGIRFDVADRILAKSGSYGCVCPALLMTYCLHSVLLMFSICSWSGY